MINHVSMYYTLGLQWWRTKIAVISPSPNHNFQSSITNLVVAVEPWSSTRGPRAACGPPAISVRPAMIKLIISIKCLFLSEFSVELISSISNHKLETQTDRQRLL